MGWEAFKRNDQEILDWLAAQRYDPKLAMLEWDADRSLSFEAGINGDLELLEWLDALGCNGWTIPWYDDGMVEGYYEGVASNGHLQVLQWLKGKDVELLISSVCEGAADGGHTHILDWLKQMGYLEENTCDMCL
jgi:hypothetical protein